MIVLLASVSRPKMVIQNKQIVAPNGSVERILWVSLNQGLLFPSAARLKTRLEEEERRGGLLVLDCSQLSWLDYSATEGLKVRHNHESRVFHPSLQIRDLRFRTFLL